MISSFHLIYLESIYLREYYYTLLVCSSEFHFVADFIFPQTNCLNTHINRLLSMFNRGLVYKKYQELR